MRKFLMLLLLLLNFGTAFAVQENGAWENAAPMPTPRSELVATVYDDRIYVAGGLSTTAQGMNTFESYDPITDTWIEASPLPVGLHHTALAATADYIYLAGGYTDSSFTANVEQAWRYDPKTGRWAAIASMPGARAAHAMVTIDGIVYVVGGVGEYETALWAYDPETDKWDTSLAPLPTRREHLAVVARNWKLYVIGGRWSGNLATLEVYDPETNTWESLPDMPEPSGGLTAAVVDGKIHVTGGETFSPPATLNFHQVYDLETNTWELWEPLPTSRHGLASAGFEDRFYVIGGATEAAGRTTETLSDQVEVFRVQ